MATNNLQFVFEPLDATERTVSAVVPVIDGQPLTDLVTAFETQRSYDPAGGYGGLVFEFFDFGPVDRYFGKTAEIFVLGCNCGEVGCWPLKCNVTVSHDLIAWENFSQPFRPGRDYSQFGPFTFDPAQYSDAVTALAARIASQG